MKKALIKTFFILCVAFLYGRVSVAQDIDSTDPYVLIKTLANNTFASIKANKEKMTDVNVARSIIRTELLPYIDNKYAAYKVIGSNLKDTTEEQRNEFTTAFTEYIIATYADALKKYTDQTIEVQEPQPIEDKIVSVKVYIKETGKPDLEVIFKMRKNQKTGQWKAYDMVAEGISLLSAKQSELSGLIRDKGIDSVSKTLLEHVAKTAGSNSK
jgi:phospholipid transport system substrate-binding protein